MMFVLTVGSVFSLLLFPTEIQANGSKTGANCLASGCHFRDASVVATNPATVIAGVDGTTDTAVTIPAAGGSFEVNYFFSNLSVNARNVVSVALFLPDPGTTAWSVGAGSTAATGLAGWNSEWDQASGGAVVNPYYLGTNSAAAEAPATLSPVVYSIDWKGGIADPWGAGGATKAAMDDGGASDHDNTQWLMGSDALITVPSDTPAGNYEVWVAGIGHNRTDTLKSYVAAKITITKEAGVNNPPTVPVVIPNQNVNEDAVNTVIDLTNYFDDVEDTAAGLTYSVQSNTNPGLVTATITGSTNVTLAYTADASGTADITVRATDSGALTVDDTFTVTVTAVNDPPSISTTAPNTATEDTLYSYDANMTDVDGPGETWSVLGGDDCGGAIVAGTGVYTFTPAGPNPPASCTLNIQVCDGGAPNECTPESQTINITAVNSAPSITSTAPSAATEDTLYSYTPTVNDPDGPATNWSVLGGDDCGGSFAAGTYSFTPVGPTPPASCALSIQLCDGGTPDECTTEGQTVNITAVNDPPTAADKTVSTAQDTTYVFAAADFNYSDPESDAFSRIQVIVTAGTGYLYWDTNGNGRAGNGSEDVANTDIILVSDIVAGELKFDPLAGQSGSPYTTFQFKVEDLPGDLSTATYTTTINVTSGANNPPFLTVNQPDGIGDAVTQGASFSVDYDLADIEDIATADFFYETDGNGVGGTAIVACADQPEGAGQTCGWDTTLIAPGDYYVYGVADDTVNPIVTAVSVGTITINAAPVCVPSAPTLLVSSNQNVKSGGTVVYTVTVSNNDNALCAATDFEVTINSETDAANAFDPSLLAPADPATVTVAPGASDTSITLTVTGNGVGTDGDFIDIELLLTDPAAEPAHINRIETPRTTIANFNPLIHSSQSTGSSKWGGDWGTATGKYGEFSCSTCHGRNTGNIKRINTKINSGTADLFPNEAGLNIVTFTTATDGISDFGDDAGSHADSTKVCEGCHSQNKYHNYNTANNLPGGDLTHQNRKDCIACHLHRKGFAAGCDTCHGNPPVTNDIDGSTTTGLVYSPAPTGGTSPVSAGAHTAHAVTMGMACITCHNGNTMPTVSNTIQMGFEVNGTNWSGFATSVIGGSLDVPQNTNMLNGFTYASGDGGTTSVVELNIDNPTCAVYCHGSWTGNGGQTITDWVVGATIADDCNDCHGGSVATPPTAGSHQKHAGNGVADLALACSSCHPSYADTAHLDGAVAWDVSGLSGTSPAYSSSASGSTGAKAPSGSYASCSGIYCHSDGDGTGGAPIQAPVWGDAATAECGDCHAIAPATNAHPEHYAAKGWTADGSNCSVCHDESAGNHVNGTPNVLATLAYSGGSCGNVAATGCHNGQSTPVWTVGTPITCSDCHTVGGSNTATVANPVSGLHGNSVASVQDHDSTLTGGCEACHVKASISGHWNGTASAAADYTKFTVGVTSAMYTDAGGTTATRGSCLSNTDLASCHSDGGEWRRLWSTEADADIAASPLPGQAVCNVCHGQYSALTASSGWNEGTVHYRSGSGSAEDKGTIHTDVGDECEDCHGYDSAATHNSNNAIDFSDGGGSYTVTLNTDRWYCATCHNAKLGEDPALTGTHTFFDSLAFPNSVAHVTGTSEPEGDCFGCHGDGSAEYWPQTVGTNQRDLTTDASYNDDGRHSLHMAEIAIRLGYTLPGDDAQQREMCGYCHTVEDGDHMTKGVGEDAEVFSSSLSLWGAADADAFYNEPNDTCATVDCHNSKQTTAGTFGWYDAGGSSCTMCHSRATAGNNPSSGLHYGSTAPTVSGIWHDDSLGSGCTQCHTSLPANGATSTHIDSTFQGGNGQKTEMGLFATYSQTGDGVGSCATTCHSGAGDNGSWARRWDSAIHYDPNDGDYVECAGCHGGFAADWTFGSADDTADGSVSHDRDWDGDSTVGEVIGNHPDNSDKCKSCHGFGYAGVYDFVTMTAHRDGKITFNDEMGYSATNFNCTTYCHSDNIGHNLENSDWSTTGNTVNGPPLACADCHATAASGSAGVGMDSPHSTNSTGYTCEECHTGHTGGAVTIANNSNVGINYGTGGISLGGTAATGSTEQEICNGCHGATYQPWNTTQGGYTTGTLSNYSNWASAAWTSANFSSYKPTTIQSNHYDQAAGMRCSYCHDVHDTMGPNTGLGGPYLRGTWTSNPFPEDGAPNTADSQVGGALFTEDADGVPRGLGGTNTGSSNALGGWQIEQNNPGVYIRATGADAAEKYAVYASLCQLCHPADTSASGILRAASFSGHAAAVDGLQDGGGNDIFNDGIRGGTSSYARGYMQHNNVTTYFDVAKEFIYGLRQGRTTTDAGVYPQVDDPTYTKVVTSWGITIGASSTDVDLNFHEFPCGKCHSPHMSALPRLMITNCLDVSHNTWGDNVGGTPANWTGYGVTPTYTASTLPYASTAANCHRYVSSSDAKQEDNNASGGNGEPGWNSVTPW